LGRCATPSGPPSSLHTLTRLRAPCFSRERRTGNTPADGLVPFQLIRPIGGFTACDGTDDTCPWRRNPAITLDEARALRRPVREYAAAALERRHRQVRRRGRKLARRDAAELHRLRIAVKKLRYTVEFFAPLYPAPRVARVSRPLKALQDALGGINDCATAARLLAQAQPAAGEAARRLVEARNAAALAGHWRRLRPAWKRLRAAGRFWER